MKLRLGAALAVLLACSMLTGAPARADLQHPRQQFLRDSVGGLFLHWGMRTAPAHTSCSSWESAVTGGGWNANYWVQEAQKLHTQYIVLATFHSRLGYARPWPSAIPGTCKTSRDFVRELIDATNAANPPMKTILYMTDDPQWWNEGLSSGQSWMNSSAYSSYKGHTVDLTTRDGFGEFSYDNFFEVMNRYPDLGGFWIDNDNAYWESHNLYSQIHSIRPNYTLSNNNEDTAEMDMISNEQKTGMTPSYDYPQAVYTAAPRLIEADFKLPSAGSWWYTGTDNSVDYKLTLGRLITNAGSSIKALMAETPMKAGKMPPAQETFNNFTNTYLNAIGESLHGTEGGGYMFGGLKPGFWNSGSHGVTTISKTNPNLHYIHVLTKPTSGSSLSLRDNGYKIASVTNLRTGAAVAFTQSGGTLTLNGISAWDQYDTVFKVVSSGREGIISPSTYTMSASGSASGHAASAAADGNYLTYWDNNGSGTSDLRFDLGSAKPIQYVGINQREDSTVFPSSGSARINAYSVAVSNDGSSWTTIKSGNLPNARGVQIIDVPLTTARHVRLQKTSSHGINRLRVDEAWIGSAYAAGGIIPVPGPGKLEAEDPPAVCNGTIDADQPGFSGSGFCNTANAVGAYAEWQVDAPAAGSYTLTFGWANGTTVDRTSTVAVNSTTIATPAFAPTGAWTTWTTTVVPATLNAGVNTIRVTGTTAGGAANLDYVTVASDGGPAPVQVQAESCTISQGLVESNHAGFTGTGFVNGDNAIGSYVECSVTGPFTSLGVRQANGTTIDRPMTVSIDGGTGTAVSFPGTGAWTTWTVVSVPVSIGAGTHTIRLTSTSANGGPNLDRLDLS